MDAPLTFLDEILLVNIARTQFDFAPDHLLPRLGIAGDLDFANRPRLPFEYLKRHVNRVVANRLLRHHSGVQVALLVIDKARQIGQFWPRAPIYHPLLQL